ncbi:prepilin-type N-terminal cleavage/methylation domain-containing protein, partial [Dehalococcoides mccartyi]
MRKLRKHQKGFTLIELLVVVAILGVLAAVIV